MREIGDEPLRIAQAHRETLHLLNALKELQHNISVRIEGVLKQTNPRDILEHAFGAYLHEISRRAYHELRTTDHISRFRRGILAAALELSGRDYAARTRATVRSNSHELANQSAQRIQEQLQEIREQFDTLDDLLHAIDSRVGIANSSSRLFVQLNILFLPTAQQVVISRLS